MSIRAGLAVLVVVSAGAAAWWVGRQDIRPDQVPTKAQADNAADSATADGPPRYRGLAIQIHTNHKVLETFVPLLDEIADLGANAVLITIPAWMDHARSQGIYIEQRRTPGRDDLIALIDAAHERDLQVILMPIILLTHPRGSEWRGRIEPPNWTQWWRDYRELIIYYADIANTTQTEALMIGSELVTTERQTREWENTIAAVRKRYWVGQLGYSANWDTYHRIEFWDKLDFVGMTSYFELVDHENPSVEELLDGWKPIRARILAWQRKTNRPIVFTEVGWCSQSGAATAPWNYYHNPRATPAGHEEQRRLYEAFLQTWADAPGVLGILFWEWTVADGGAGDYGYTPKRKPAEQELRQWFDTTADPEPAAQDGE